MESEERRYKGIRKDDGKIIKGTLTEAPLKLRASSIPTKTENVVYSNHHKSAFGNSQERFYTPINQKTEYTPGPANYNPLSLANRIESKKGSGSFASATKLTRFNQKRNWNPGPGRYDFSLSKEKRAKSTYQFRANSTARELFKDQISAASKLPGPADYDESLKRSISNYNSIFKSNINRFHMANAEIPPIGFYQWEEHRKRVVSLKFGEKSSKASEKNTSIHYKHLESLVGKKGEAFQEVGPGKYTPNVLAASKGFTIKQNNIDRFGTLKEKFAIAPKGQDNELQIPKETDAAALKGNPHSSVFKSKSKRYEFGEQEREMVGDPGQYSPSKIAHQSHIINFAQKWI